MNPFFDHRRHEARRRGPAGEPGRARRVQSFFTRDVWARELASLPTFSRFGYGFARVAHLTVTNFVKDRCSWRASALTYITVLSLVPLLALAFSVAKGLGAYERLRTQTIDPFLENTFGGQGEVDEVLEKAAESVAAKDAAAELEEAELEEAGLEEAGLDVEGAADAEAPIGDAAPSTESELPTDSTGGLAGEAVAPDGLDTDPPGGAQVRAAFEMVLEFVESTDVSSLGALGFLIVLWTVIKLLGSIETSFNDIWGVHKARSWPRKIADYFSTVVLVPLLLITGTTVLQIARSERFGGALGLSGETPALAVIGYLVVIWMGFTFAYILMPNTRTRITSAIVGGIVGGTMWSIFQWAHLKLQVGVANYNAIYSTFAALPIFLFWVQSSWMTVLLGAEAAAAHQNQARHGQLVRSRDYDLAQKEVVGLRLVTRLTKAFLAGRGPQGIQSLADEMACPERVLQEVVRSLEMGGIVATVDGDLDEPAVLLATDPGRVRIQGVLDSLKGPSKAFSVPGLGLEAGPDDQALQRAFDRFRAERDATSANLTLRQLVETEAGTPPGE